MEDKPLKRFANRDRIADIAQAKRTAEKFGYKVELDDGAAEERIKRPFKATFKHADIPAKTVKPSTANRSNDSVIDALRTATDAGYAVRKMTDIEMAKDTVERNGYSVVKKTPVEQPPKAAETPAAPEEKPDPYLSRASYFMYDEENQ